MHKYLDCKDTCEVVFGSFVDVQDLCFIPRNELITVSRLYWIQVVWSTGVTRKHMILIRIGPDPD